MINRSAQYRRLFFNSLRRFSVRKESRLQPSVVNHLVELSKHHEELGSQLQTVTDSQDLAIIGKKYSELSKIVCLQKERLEYIDQLASITAMESEAKVSNDDDILGLAILEREEISTKMDQLEANIIATLTPKDEADDRGAVLEVRAGTGGDEASLFAGDIFKMYQKYAFLMGWEWEEVYLSRSEIGGFKEAQANITGDAVFKRMKFESGVHRVQRIPVNDTKIQTSAASVAVLPIAEELDVQIRPEDLRIDVFRSGGAGGQSVNKTESAVRMTHIPTGIVVSMQDERSQQQNRVKALKYLRARVYEHERSKKDQLRNELRYATQGSGDRADKIRTYNFPQDRVSDHRISMTVSSISRVLSGEELGYIIDALVDADEKEKLNLFLQSLEEKQNEKKPKASKKK